MRWANLMGLVAVTNALAAVYLAQRGSVTTAVVTALNGITVALVALSLRITTAERKDR